MKELNYQGFIDGRLRRLICVLYYRPHLDGGQTLLQGGEFLVQALQALSSNVLDLADEFNEKMLRLEKDIHEYDILKIFLAYETYMSV